MIPCSVCTASVTKIVSVDEATAMAAAMVVKSQPEAQTFNSLGVKYSNAPISTGVVLVNPLWSTVGAPTLVPPLIARLKSSKIATVAVGPPLSANVSNPGSSVEYQVPEQSSQILLSLTGKEPEPWILAFELRLSARMVFVNLSVL